MFCSIYYHEKTLALAEKFLLLRLQKRNTFSHRNSHNYRRLQKHNLACWIHYFLSDTFQSMKIANRNLVREQEFATSRRDNKVISIMLKEISFQVNSAKKRISISFLATNALFLKEQEK